MKYQILWFKSALDELTEIWLQAPSGLRKSINKASNDLEARLASILASKASRGQTGAA